MPKLQQRMVARVSIFTPLWAVKYTDIELMLNSVVLAEYLATAANKKTLGRKYA